MSGRGYLPSYPLSAAVAGYMFAAFEEDTNGERALAVYFTSAPDEQSVIKALDEIQKQERLFFPRDWRSGPWHAEDTPVSERANLHRVMVYGCYREK